MIWGEVMEKLNKKRLTSVLFAVIIALFMVLVMSTKMLKGVDNFTYDYIYEKENSYNDDIIIVGIDEKSLNELGVYNTWTRDYYAKVINTINTDSPAVIGLDVLFTGKTNEKFIDADLIDKSLVDAAKNSNNIVFGSEIKFVDNVDDLEYKKVMAVDKPFDDLYQAIGDDSLGYTNTIADYDSVVRHITLNLTYDDVNYSSFSEQIYKKYCEYNDIDFNQYETGKSYLINYNGKPNDGYDAISFSDVYNKTGEYYPGIFDDRIVLIGWYASGNAYNGGADSFYTPISHKVEMNGVEIHANIINNMQNGMFIKDANKGIQYLINILIVLVVIYIIARFSFIYASISAAVSIIFEGVLGLVLYNNQTFYPTTSIALIIFIGYIVIVVYNYVRERLEKGAVIKTFKQYMAPQVVEAFMKDNKQSSNLIGERRDVACLFVDIRGFTRMSETLVDPVKVVKILNDYLGMTTKQIFDNDGMLDKFIGDACMAIFNAPFDIEDYEFKAIKAGLGIVKYGEPIAKQVFDDYGITIGFGVGVNCGEAIIGNIGCDFRKDYTGIGDTINTASRLESNAKGGQVIISEETLNRVDKDGKYILKDRLIVEENGYLNLKGKAKPVLTFNVIGIKEEKGDENSEVIDDSKD